MIDDSPLEFPLRDRVALDCMGSDCSALGELAHCNKAPARGVNRLTTEARLVLRVYSCSSTTQPRLAASVAQFPP